MLSLAYAFLETLWFEIKISQVTIWKLYNLLGIAKGYRCTWDCIESIRDNKNAYRGMYIA